MKNIEISETLLPLPTLPPILIKSLSSEHIDKVIQVHKQAFRGYPNTQLGDAYLRAFFGWFIDSKQGIMLGAFDKQNHLAGYVIGASLGYGAELNKHIFIRALIGSLTHFWVFLNPSFLNAVLLKLGFGRVQAPKAPQLISPVMSLIRIGVLQSARGKKVGEALIIAFEDQAIEYRMKSLRLSVYPDNVVARKFYEKMKWLPSEETMNAKIAMYYYKSLDDYTN